MQHESADEAAVGQRLPLMGTLLRVPYSVVGEAAEEGLRAAGCGDVRRPHFTVLQPLLSHPDGLRLTDLAAAAHVTKPSMVYLVQHLEAGGYVVRTADPVDGRAQRWQLTERGLAATRAIREAVVATEADWAARIGPDRLEQLRELLRDLSLALSRNGAQPHWDAADLGAAG